MNITIKQGEILPQSMNDFMIHQKDPGDSPGRNLFERLKSCIIFHMVRYLERRVKGISRFLRRVILSFSAHDCPKHAAAISYYTLFSIFPLLLFLVYIASFFFPSEESRRVISEYLHGIIPYGVENLNEILDQTWNARSSMGLVSGLWLLWGGSSFFNAMVSSLNHIWESSPRSYLQRRILAIVVVIILVVSFIASFIIGPVTNFLLDRTGSGRQIFSYLFELFSVTVVLLLIYRVFPNRTVDWNAAFAGAFSAGVLVIFAKFAFRVYTSLVINRSGLLYGSLTWFLTFALWVYLLAILSLFGAEFAAAYQRRQDIIRSNRSKLKELENQIPPKD